MSFSEHGSRPEHHPKEPSKLDRQLDILKSTLVTADLSDEQKAYVFLLISRIEAVINNPNKSTSVSETVTEPRETPVKNPQESVDDKKQTPETREAVEMGSEKALMDAWGAVQREYAKDPDFSFMKRFTEAAKAAGWNVEPVLRSENELLVCGNDQKQQFVVFNPGSSYSSPTARWFDRTSDSPNISGRMINWELVKPARVADGMNFMSIDSWVESSTFVKGVLRAKVPVETQGG